MRGLLALACAAALTDGGGQVTRPEFPAGTLRRPMPSYERAIASLTPPELTFAIEGEPTVEHGSLVVRGVLRNTSDREVEAIIFPSGNGVALHAQLRTGTEVEFWRTDDPERPKDLPILPPPAPPPPMAIAVPPHAEVGFTAREDLSRYKYRGAPRVLVDWTFLFWNEPKPHGSLEVRLPKR